MTDTSSRSPHAEHLAHVIRERHSCRGFLSDPVERSTITRMLELAQASPSWCNTQPWQLIVTEGPGTERFRRALADYASSEPPAPDIAFPEAYVDEAQERRRTCAWQLYEAVGVERGDRVASAAQANRNFELFGAPHVAIVTTDRRLGTYGAVDCGVYLGNLITIAASLGLATIPQAAIATAAPLIREMFDVPEHRDVLCGLSFGYEDPSHPANAFRTERATLDDAVRWAAE